MPIDKETKTGYSETSTTVHRTEAKIFQDWVSVTYEGNPMELMHIIYSR